MNIGVWCQYCTNHFDFFDTLQGVGNLWHCILWRSLPHLHFTLNPNPEFTSRPSASASSSTSQICKEWSHLDCTIIIHQGNKICCPWIITKNGWSLISLWTLGYHTPTAADSSKEVEGHKTSIVAVNDGNKGCQHKQLPISLLVSKRDKSVIYFIKSRKDWYNISFDPLNLSLTKKKREIPAQKLF